MRTEGSRGAIKCASDVNGTIGINRNATTHILTNAAALGYPDIVTTAVELGHKYILVGRAARTEREEARANRTRECAGDVHVAKGINSRRADFATGSDAGISADPNG